MFWFFLSIIVIVVIPIWFFATNVTRDAIITQRKEFVIDNVVYKCMPSYYLGGPKK